MAARPSHPLRIRPGRKAFELPDFNPGAAKRGFSGNPTAPFTRASKINELGGFTPSGLRVGAQRVGIETANKVGFSGGGGSHTPEHKAFIKGAMGRQE